jgi:DNA invertase Pin-like site-specific DNA recombinase
VLLGRAGIVLGPGCSRLACDSADWQQLIKICAHNDTLICDEDGLYDPASLNDRLLLVKFRSFAGSLCGLRERV